MISRRQSVLLSCLLLGACGQSAKDSDKSAPVEVAASTGAVAAVAPPPAFGVCGSCHAVGPGQQGVGPSLAGVWGRRAGSAPGYAYSPALKASGIVWDAKALDTWLKGPMQMVPGTKMVIGIPNPEARQSVIAFLETLK